MRVSTALYGTDIPRLEFCSSTVVSIAVDLAATTFNSGKVSLQSLFDRLGLSCGSLTSNFFQSQDDNGVWLAEWKSSDLVKQDADYEVGQSCTGGVLGGGGGCAIRGWGMVGVEEEGVPYEAGGW